MKIYDLDAYMVLTGIEDSFNLIGLIDPTTYTDPFNNRQN